MKKTTKIIIGIIVIVALGFMLNPFYWLMRPKERPKQPELSKEEILLFKKLKSTYYKCESERFYYNFTQKGNDTLYEKKYNMVPFEYSLSLERINEYDLNDNLNDDLNDNLNDNLTGDLVHEIGLIIKNDILKRNKFLRKISIYVDHKPYEYLYNLKKDSLIIVKN